MQALFLGAAAAGIASSRDCRGSAGLPLNLAAFPVVLVCAVLGPAAVSCVFWGHAPRKLFFKFARSDFGNGLPVCRMSNSQIYEGPGDWVGAKRP